MEIAVTPVTSLDKVMHGVVVLGERIVECNERFCRILECGRDELVGRPLLELCPELQSDGAFSRERWQRRWQAAQAGIPQWFPWQFRNCHGRRVHALVHLGSVRGEDATLTAHVHDLSNLHRAGWISPETHEKLQRVLDHTKAVIFVKDRDGRYVFANRELERVVRMTAERIVGRTDQELWPPEVAAHFQANDAHVLQQRTAAEFEVTAEVGRQRRTFLSFKFPLFGTDGEPYAVCGVATDITDPKRTQEALTNAALAVSSAQGATVFQELVRYLATILEVEAAVISAPHDTDSAQLCVRAFYLDGELKENYEYPKDGTPCNTVFGQTFRIYTSGVASVFPDDADLIRMGFESYAGYPMNDGSGRPVGLISVMSRRPMLNAEFVESILKIFAVRAAAELERQRAEENLRRSEQSYRAIFEASEDGVFVHDWETGALLDVNRRVCVMTGFTYDEIKHMTIADLSTGVYPYTGEEAAKRIAEAKTGRTVRFEWQGRSRDGSVHWYDVVLRPAEIAGEKRVVAFVREIDERKKAEQALRQAQKMEALGHLTGGIAHDFNNLLTSIMGYIVLASDQPATAEARRKKYLEQAQASCTRARDLIQQMLTFSRGQRGEPRPVSMAALVSQSIKLFGGAMPGSIEVKTDLPAEVSPVMLDPVHLDQILLNLCLNARDAMNGSGTIRVSVQDCDRCEEVCTACRQPATGGYAELRVEDEGPGIPPEVIDRIFEPFFTTKEVGKGSGMGLASVHGLVHELGGHIVVEPVAPHGTRFRVLFPALVGDHAAGEAHTKATAAKPLCSLEGRVLVVDDEKTVSTYMCDLLESWGLEVTTASNAQNALTACNADGPFDFVITDYKMPGMTGLQLARELRAARPELPVVLYTGFNEGLSRGEIEAAGLRAVVTKPVDPHELFGLLQTGLANR